MKINYYPDTDSLYIDLSSKPSADSREVSDGIVLDYDADGDLVGEVAESWEATPDAKTWIFNIRRSIEFHDGSTLTPDDVVASINYHRAKDSKSAAKPLLAQVTDIKTQGNALVINLVAGNADLPTLIADYHLPIMPSKNGKVDAASGIGCGPYALQSWDPGIRAIVTRHRNYWKAGAAHFDRIKMFAIIDQTARTSALVAGQVDLIGRADLKTLAFLKRDPTLSVISVSGNQHYTFPMLTNVAPFDDNSPVASVTKIKDSAGGERTVKIGRIPVDITVARNPLLKGTEPNLPDALRKVSESIAGKPVEATRVYIALVVFIITTAISGSLLYGGIRSAIISIGRNPLSKKSIIRGMLQVVISGLIIFILGIFGVYLLLKL